MISKSATIKHAFPPPIFSSLVTKIHVLVALFARESPDRGCAKPFPAIRSVFRDLVCKMNLVSRSAFVILGVVVMVVEFTFVVGFPDGAPVEACIYSNFPNHAGTKPLSPKTFPFEFVASSDKYFPGQKIRGN